MTQTARHLVLATALALSAGAASAASISLNTGVDDFGATLAQGAADSRWTISVDGGSTFAAAQVNYASQICCGMESAASTAAWITDSGTATSSATGWGVGNTVYLRRAFDLTGFDLSSTQLAATWRLADNLVGIYLNGNLVESAISSTWFTDRSILVTSGFNAGLNVLEVRGSSVNSAWDGLWLAGTVTGRDADGTVPLPGSLPLAVLALAAVALLRERRA